MEGCLRPRPAKSGHQGPGDEEAATHVLSLINNVNARLEPRVTFLPYPLEGQGTQTPKSWVTGEEKEKHIPADPRQTSSHSPFQMFPTLHPHTDTQTHSPPLFPHIPSPPHSLLTTLRSSQASGPIHLHTPTTHSRSPSHPKTFAHSPPHHPTRHTLFSSGAPCTTSPLRTHAHSPPPTQLYTRAHPSVRTPIPGKHPRRPVSQ